MLSYLYQNHPFKRNEKKRGSVLFLTLLFLVLINLFAVAFWKIVPVEMHSAKRQMIETEAYFASDAGIVDSLAFLEDVTSEGNLDNYINNNGVVNADGHLVLERTGEINNWTWECQIIPGPETFGHRDFTTPNPLRVFKIEAVARRPGITGNSQQYRQVSAWVKQKSFTDFNWNCSEFDMGNPLQLFMTTFRLGGTYRTNGPAIVRILESDNLWSLSEAAIGGELIFAQATHHPSLGFVDGVQYTSWGESRVPFWTTGANAGEPRGDRYSKLVRDGRAGVRHSDRVEMPVNNDSVAFGVWGTTTPTSALTNAQKLFGATSNVDAAINDSSTPGTARNGIWIDGDVDQIEFSLTNGVQAGTPQAENENQVIKIWQGGAANDYIEIQFVTARDFTIPATATVVNGTHSGVLSPAGNGGKGYTVIRNGTSNTYRVYNEQTNGAIYTTGNVRGVRGTVKGRRTIGVSTDTGANTANDRQIEINGPLLYSGTVPGESPGNDANDMLGLIGYAVRMKDTAATAAPTAANPQLGRMWPTRQMSSPTLPHYLYCSIFAGRRNDPYLGNANATTFGGGFGSMSAGNSSFGKGHMILYGSITEGIRQHKGTGDTSGNSYAFFLDDNLRKAQPPFFPSLPSYDVMTWEEKSVFSY